jgi:hypothetical protein
MITTMLTGGYELTDKIDLTLLQKLSGARKTHKRLIGQLSCHGRPE